MIESAPSLKDRLTALPTVGSISVTIRGGQYTFHASRRTSFQPLSIPTIEVHADSFEAGAEGLIRAFSDK